MPDGMIFRQRMEHLLHILGKARKEVLYLTRQMESLTTLVDGREARNELVWTTWTPEKRNEDVPVGKE